jgi:hypothetical protein
VKGRDWIVPVFNAITQKRVLKISYHPFSGEAFELYFHPYCLKQCNPRWFVFGINELEGKQDWNLALDRIVTLRECDKKFKKCTEIYSNDYFEYFVGVSKPNNGKEEQIV